MQIGSDAHWILPGRLLAARAPRGPEELQEMARAGVTDVLSLVEGSRERLWSDDAGLRFAERRMPEMGAPTPEELLPALRHVRRVLGESGTCLLIHCHAGMGRAAVVAALYLAVSAGLDPVEAVAEVRRRRPGALWGPEKELAVEEFLRLFRAGQVLAPESGPCRRCEARVVHPFEVCFHCSGRPSIDAFFGCGPPKGQLA